MWSEGGETLHDEMSWQAREPQPGRMARTRGGWHIGPNQGGGKAPAEGSRVSADGGSRLTGGGTEREGGKKKRYDYQAGKGSPALEEIARDNKRNGGGGGISRNRGKRR